MIEAVLGRSWWRILCRALSGDAWKPAWATAHSICVFVSWFRWCTVDHTRRITIFWREERVQTFTFWVQSCSSNTQVIRRCFSDHRASYVHMPYICIYVEYLCMCSKYASRTSRTARTNLAVPETVPSVPGDMDGRCHGNSLYPLKRCSFRDDVVLIWAVLGCKCYRFSECTQHRSCLGMNVKLVSSCANRSNILQHRTWPFCPSKHCDVILRR